MGRRRVEPREQRLGTAAEPAAELEHRTAPVFERACRRDRADRVRDAVERVRVREVFRPRDDAFGIEERLLAGKLAAKHRRIALGRYRGDAKRRQATLVVRSLRRKDLLRVERRQRRRRAEARAVARPRQPLDPAARGERREEPRRGDARDRRGEPARRIASSTLAGSAHASASPVDRNAPSASRGTYSSISPHERTNASSKSGRISAGMSAALASPGARFVAVTTPRV